MKPAKCGKGTRCEAPGVQRGGTLGCQQPAKWDGDNPHRCIYHQHVACRHHGVSRGGYR